MIIPSEYYKENKIVKLSQFEIDEIKQCLNDESHDIFVFMKYQKILDKLNAQSKHFANKKQ